MPDTPRSPAWWLGIAAALQALSHSTLTTLTAFEVWSITGPQQAAVSGLVASVLGVGTAIVAAISMRDR